VKIGKMPSPEKAKVEENSGQNLKKKEEPRMESALAKDGERNKSNPMTKNDEPVASKTEENEKREANADKENEEREDKSRSLEIVKAKAAENSEGPKKKNSVRAQGAESAKVVNSDPQEPSSESENKTEAKVLEQKDESEVRAQGAESANVVNSNPQEPSSESENKTETRVLEQKEESEKCVEIKTFDVPKPQENDRKMEEVENFTSEPAEENNKDDSDAKESNEMSEQADSAKEEAKGVIVSAEIGTDLKHEADAKHKEISSDIEQNTEAVPAKEKKCDEVHRSENKPKAELTKVKIAERKVVSEEKTQENMDVPSSVERIVECA